MSINQNFLTNTNISNNNDQNDQNDQNVSDHDNMNHEEPFDVNYVIDKEIENSYVLVYNLSKKYGEKFLETMGCSYYTSELRTYNGFQNCNCYDKQEEVERRFKEDLMSNFEEDVYTTHYDFFLSHFKYELRFNPDIFHKVVDDDTGVILFKWYFGKKCIYSSEIVKAYNTIRSQKQRLPFCVVRLTYNDGSNKIKSNYLIKKDYIQQAEEVLYNLIVDYGLQEYISKE